MVGQRRLDNVHDILQAVLKDDIRGDFIETGIWRGGVALFAAAFFKVRLLMESGKVNVSSSLVSMLCFAADVW
jgi:hypothetical protein